MHAVIVSNGFPPTKELLEAEIEFADLVIGADGGGNKILSYGITPDAVIGDLDSFKKPDTINFEIIHDKSQETNDLEKALSLVLKKKAKTCTVLGAFGKRMDHALKNLSVLKRFKPDFDQLTYKDELFEAFIISDRYRTEAPVGSMVSLFPLSGEVIGITTSGLKYPLENEILKNGLRDGTSNETTEPEFSIQIESGDLVVFVERKGN
ncbi:MAG TPA: thiamine diphosphokinase [Gracilimonas sp.]|uniref:thiamine diphosphokinase n=1 Tax=Gracilimonas sp. TaxID=1974203 RepID=UPI002D823704|nr:thiamine diphosphokinase [Gracilimonas sp.]